SWPTCPGGSFERALTTRSGSVTAMRATWIVSWPLLKKLNVWFTGSAGSKISKEKDCSETCKGVSATSEYGASNSAGMSGRQRSNLMINDDKSEGTAPEAPSQFA